MEMIRVDAGNLAKEHICCAISDSKGENCIGSKKAWLAERFAEGLIFRKMDARGKAFIEYIPAEAAWCPIEAAGYLHIHCLWVSGQLQGQGFAGRLLAACVEDAKRQGKRGVSIVSAPRKMAFLSDPKFLRHTGFRVADSAAPYFELLYLPLTEDAPPPRFKECAKHGRIAEPGIVLYYTHQCPFTDKYAPLLQTVAAQHGRAVTLRKLETTAQAQAAPSPFPTYSLFIDGEFITNEILSAPKFAKMLAAPV